MRRIKGPTEGMSKRVGASLAASAGLHLVIAGALAGVVYQFAEGPPKPRVFGDVMMSAGPSAVPDYAKPHGPIGPNLDDLLKGEKRGLGDLTPSGTPTGNLTDLINTTGDAPVGTAVGTDSGASSALSNLPSGTGVVFAGLRATGEQARSVVYVIDASGPMVSSLADVLAEVNRSIEQLLPTQKFGVVVFHDGGAKSVEVFDTTLRESNSRNRVELRGWMAKLAATGRSNPMDGLRAAINLRPQAIFLLSRSITRTNGGVWDVGPDATLAELDRLNPADASGGGRRGIVIKTIQFQEPDPTGTMERIALSHGGKSAGSGPAYRVMKREELPRR